MPQRKTLSDDPYADLMHYKNLEKSEEYRLLDEAQAGCIESQNKLVMHNLRGIAKICNCYATTTVARQELYALGIEALIECIGKFNPAKYNNIRLITFARKSIHGKVQRSNEVNKSVIIIPYHLRQLRYHITNALKEIDYRNYSIDELIDYILNETDIIKTTVSRDMLKYLIADVANLENLVSLSSSVPTTHCFSESDPLESQISLLFDLKIDADYVDEIQIEIDFNRITACLDNREKDIVFCYWGIGKKETFEKIGKRYKMTKGGISKIYIKAMAKLQKEADRLMKGNKGIINI